MGIEYGTFVKTWTLETYGKDDFRLSFTGRGEKCRIVGSQRVAQLHHFLIGTDCLVPHLIVESQTPQDGIAGATSEASALRRNGQVRYSSL